MLLSGGLTNSESFKMRNECKHSLRAIIGEQPTCAQQIQSPCSYFVVEVEESDTRLDYAVCVLLVDLDDLLHTAQIHADAGRRYSRIGTLAQIASSSDSPEGNSWFVCVCCFHQSLYLFNSCQSQYNVNERDIISRLFQDPLVG